MSAKLAYQKAPVNLPELPTEIWGLILRYATRVPDTLEDLSMERYSGTNLRRKRYRGALVTKRHIVLVCQTWNEMASPYLYEHIHVNCFDKLEEILKTLVLPLTGNKSRFGPTFGYLTKRLDITASQEGHLGWGGKWVSVLRLFRLAPNTTILRVDYQAFKGVVADHPYFRSKDGMDVVLPNLTTIDLAEAFQVPTPPLASHYLAMMGCHPNLRRLDLMAARLIPDLAIALPLSTSPIQPGVREIDFFPDELASWNIKSIFPPGVFPNLKKAVALCHSRSLDTLAECLRAHGRPLKCLLLTYDDSMIGPRGLDRSLQTWYDSEAMLGIMKESCPSLEELSFSAANARIPSIPMVVRASTVLETVTTLGIEIAARHFQFSKNVCAEFFDSALSWTRRTSLPNLRTIRFISETNVLHLQKRHAKRLDAFLKKCRVAGVEVQDSFHIPLIRQTRDSESSTGSGAH